MNVMLILSLVFIAYYSFVIYTFYRLHLNMCSCQKLEKYKKTWQFNTIVILSFVFLLYNIFHVYRKLNHSQFGGGLLVSIQILILFGYGLTFFHDYVILDLLGTMRKDKCPCQQEYRHYVEITTYMKMAINAFFVVAILLKLDNKLLKKVIKKQSVKKK
jgi:cation transport ATPase